MWILAAEEEGNDNTFVRELVALTSDMIKTKQSAVRAGEMGTKSRVQPRHQKNRSADFDRVCAARIKGESQTAASKQSVHMQAHAVAEAEQVERLRRLGLTEEQIDAPTTIDALAGSPTSDDDNDETAALVLIPGSKTFTAGFAGDDAPCALFPSKVGRPRHAGVMVGMGQKEAYVGDEAQCKRGILSLKQPIERGMFTNWDDVRATPSLAPPHCPLRLPRSRSRDGGCYDIQAERLFHHALYNELRVAPEEHAIVVTDSPCSPRADRERLCQLLFETFGARHVHLTTKPILALFSSGRTTGISVHVGDSGVTVLPVYEGFGLAHALHTSDIGGRHVTDQLMAIMTERGYSFVRTHPRPRLAASTHLLRMRMRAPTPRRIHPPAAHAPA